jgi:FkbM family methyltransferase
MNILNVVSNKPAVQIGANVGNDEFYKICKQFNPSEIILIEPNIKCQQSLKECYKDILVNVNYEVVAITTDSNVSEVIMRNPCPAGSSAHMSIIPMNDWVSDVKLKVSATTITNIFEKYNLYNIGILYIDTEGNDARIIDSIDFDKYNIDIIIYESWGFAQSCFEKYDKLNGIDGMQYIKKKLEGRGYTINLIDQDTNFIAYKL